MKHLSKIVLSIMVISILLSSSGCKKENAVIGKVNGDELSTNEFKFFLDNEKTQMLIEAGVSKSDPNQSQIVEYWKVSSNQTKARTKAFDDLVKFEIQYADAKKNNFRLQKVDEDAFISNFSKQYKGNVNFKTLLNENLGITVEEFEELTSNTFYVSKYEEQETKKIEVADSEIKDYYDKNKDKFDTTTVRSILFLTEGKTDKEKEEAKKKAEGILEKVRTGDDMAVLAENNSEDPGVIDNKGEYKVKKDGQMVKPFEDWAISAKVGDTEIVETIYGYHVMKCEKKSTFDDIKNAVKEAIQKEKYPKKIEAEKNDKSTKIEKNQSAIDKVKF